ncbi:hypothetical protein JTE90_003548 [Oedothorax gibbosus]|uniref:Uncharacterized protein n=1 Tax=Oedothorax gibbosus TaxID=931172 RepID=A0AAV6VLH9_9ARAC|nr:hypothetical protein JTE90_003548 [Oedothorax gibbosus]
MDAVVKAGIISEKSGDFGLCGPDGLFAVTGKGATPNTSFNQNTLPPLISSSVLVVGLQMEISSAPLIPSELVDLTPRPTPPEAY